MCQLVSFSVIKKKKSYFSVVLKIIWNFWLVKMFNIALKIFLELLSGAQLCLTAMYISEFNLEAWILRFHKSFWSNSLWPSDAIWRLRSGSTLAQVMACCLTAPSHCLNQCWLTMNMVQCHSYEGSFRRYPSHWPLKSTHLKFALNLPGANELRWWCYFQMPEPRTIIWSASVFWN